MFDSRIRPLIDPPLKAVARRLVALGVAADHITLFGFALGLCAAIAAALGAFATAFALILAGRICDGLDGPVARAAQSASDRGGFIDITLDFVFYAAVPVAFAIHDPQGNALAAAVLLSGFLVNATAFLAFAVAAKGRNLTSQAQGRKAFYYMSGLAEGTETVLVFLAFCLFPSAFWWLALAFAGLCWVSGLARIALAYRQLA